jgi:hypothetical protein
MKNFLIGLGIVIVALVLGVGASFGSAMVISRVAANQNAAGAAQRPAFRMNRNGTNRMGPGMRRNMMPGWRQGQPGTGPGFQNQAPNGGQNNPGGGQGNGMPGPCYSWNKNGQSGQYGNCPYMNPGGKTLPQP